MSKPDELENKMAEVDFLRQSLHNMVYAHPCPTDELLKTGKIKESSCHCPTCEAQHCLTCTGGYQEKLIEPL